MKLKVSLDDHFARRVVRLCGGSVAPRESFRVERDGNGVQIFDDRSDVPVLIVHVGGIVTRRIDRLPDEPDCDALRRAGLAARRFLERSER